MTEPITAIATRRSGTGLALVGYRATGKSTIGRLIATRAGLPFADADIELETQLVLSIPQVFQTRGETAFRDAEQDVLQRLTSRQGLVLATGGGAILRAANRQSLRKLGMVAWLQAPQQTIAARLLRDQDQNTARPPLTPAGTIGEIATLLQEREPLYREVSDLAIDTSSLSPVQLADQLLEAWQRWLSLPLPVEA